VTTVDPDGRKAGRLLGRLSGDQRIWVMSCSMALVSLVLYVTIVGHYEPIHPLPLPWWVLAAMFGFVEVFVVQFDVRDDTVSFSLIEIPLVLGLFFAGPANLVLGQLAGAAAALVLYRRQKPIKLAFNLSLLALQACLALSLFHPIVSLGDPLGPAGWAAALLVTHSLDVLSSVAVALAISLKEGKRMVLQGLLGVGTAITFANTGLALLGVIVVWTHPASSWLLLVAAGVVFLALHAHGSLRRTHNKLRVLYESSRAVESATEIDSMLFAILSRARDMLRAEVAEITLFGAVRGEPASRVTLGPQDRWEPHQMIHLDPTQGVWARVVAEERGVLLARPIRSERLRAHFDADGIRDAIVVPLRAEAGVIGTMLVANRLGDLATFDEEDLNLLETVARHTTSSLEMGRLLERLRQEAATNEHLALHDTLTGLPNRAWFLQRLNEAIEEAGNDGSLLAVILMDLDRFKEVNDTLGHHNGDELLKEMGSRLRGLLDDDAVARLGGDEFAVLVARTPDPQTALHTAKEIVHALEAPFEVQSLRVDVRLSAGIAVFPADGEDASTLLQRADVAMYLAKEARSDCEPYSPDKDPYSPTRLALIGELRTAVENRDIFLVYQPQVDLRTGEVFGVEALARWEHPRRGLVPPGEFIPIAEHSGIIKQMTLVALEIALSERDSSLSRELGHIPVSVNLSARMLEDEGFPDEVTRLLDRYGVPFGGLCLELTESSIMADPDHSRIMLTRLAEAGVRLSIDDFGTGYSSLSYLSRLPLDEIKIDRSFVSRMSQDARDASIVESTVGLGHALGLTVVAEGIEDEATMSLLARLGCDVAQGYHIGMPMHPAKLKEWFDDREGVAPSAAAGQSFGSLSNGRRSPVEVLAEHRIKRRSS
jgi:diguanylate cyclase (GGDEF)-like protein